MKTFLPHLHFAIHKAMHICFGNTENTHKTTHTHMVDNWHNQEAERGGSFQTGVSLLTFFIGFF